MTMLVILNLLGFLVSCGSDIDLILLVI